MGTMETDKALSLAQERGLDLVEISPNENPPVAKILDFGQFKYDLKKKEKKQKTKQKGGETKGIRLSFRVGKHDLELKKKRAGKFLEEGYKVKIEMKLRGREKAHKDMAEDIIKRFIQSLQEETAVKIDQPVNRQGSRLTAVISK